MSGIILKIEVLFLTLTAFLGGIFVQPPKGDCYSGVEITGYYGVLLNDYDTQIMQAIQVGSTTRTYNASFLADARAKTGGISSTGENLLYIGGQWSTTTQALDSNDFPKEADYTALETVTTTEDAKARTLPRAFVQEVAKEGTGKLAEGEYLGRPWDGKWHIRNDAYDASERPIIVGVVAVDPQYFDHDNPRSVTITPPPAGFEQTAFTARDLGEAIANKHIDIFTGWGVTDGLPKALAVTSSDHTVCFEHRDTDAAQKSS